MSPHDRLTAICKDPTALVHLSVGEMLAVTEHAKVCTQCSDAVDAVLARAPKAPKKKYGQGREN